MAHTRTKFKTVASVTIKDADKMTLRQRRLVAEWLRRHADSILTDGRKYVSGFRGRLYGAVS